MREVDLRTYVVSTIIGKEGARHVVKQITISYPEGLPAALNLSEEQFAAEVRFLAAAKLLEMGKLSSGKAVDLAGLGRVDFLQKLGAYDFHAINLDDQEIEAELKAAADLER